MGASPECHFPFSKLTGVTRLMDIDLPKKFSPLYISRLIPQRVGKEGIAKLSRLCNTGRLLSPLVPQVECHL